MSRLNHTLPPRVIDKDPPLLFQAPSQGGNQLSFFLPVFAVVNGGSQVIGAMGKGAVWPVLHAIASRVRLIHACAGLVVAQVVSPLCVPGVAMKVGAAVWGSWGGRGGGDAGDYRASKSPPPPPPPSLRSCYTLTHHRSGTFPCSRRTHYNKYPGCN